MSLHRRTNNINNAIPHMPLGSPDSLSERHKLEGVSTQDEQEIVQESMMLGLESYLAEPLVEQMRRSKPRKSDW